MAGSEDWLERIAHVRQWARKGERAPHKPLLLLYLLGRLQRTGSTEVSYAEAEPTLAQLLQDFGPPGRRTSPAYPFHHLPKRWSLGRHCFPWSGAGKQSDTAPADGATGRLVPDLEQALLGDGALLVLAARTLLDANFPESLHGDICALVGLDLEAIEGRVARGRAATLASGPGISRSRLDGVRVPLCHVWL